MYYAELYFMSLVYLKHVHNLKKTNIKLQFYFNYITNHFLYIKVNWIKYSQNHTELEKKT